MNMMIEGLYEALKVNTEQRKVIERKIDEAMKMEAEYKHTPHQEQETQMPSFALEDQP